MNKIIFHIPQKINIEKPVGSAIRPIKLIDAFQKLGYDVTLIWGSAKERKAALARLKLELQKGTKYEFLYSESSTMPTLLTEANHLPISPSIDFGLFKICKKYEIKIGLFYRDIYWRFPFYNPGVFKKMLAKSMYYYDLIQYRKYLDILYVPSNEMAAYLPLKGYKSIIELPPGIDNDDAFKTNGSTSSNKDKLNIFYVGGLGEVYQLQEFVAAVASLENVQLRLCTRPNEWAQNKDKYDPYLNDNITIVHKSGKELAEEYQRADITCLALEPSEYRKFCFPIKVFEYLSWNKPIFTISDTKVGDFVAQNDIGWTVNYDRNSIAKALKGIVAHPEEIELKKENMLACRDKHTWMERAKQIAKELGQ